MGSFLSPLRYPGGKGWMLEYVRLWFSLGLGHVREFVEPFCGGASVGLFVAAQGLADHVSLYELDPNVAAVWQTIINDEGGLDWLLDKLAGFQFNEAAARWWLARDPASLDSRERAFWTILYNRLSFGGSMAGGSGLGKLGRSGYKGGGWNSLWNIEVVCRRLKKLAPLRDRISFAQADALELLPELPARSTTAVLLDPPYTAGKRRPGRRLYNHATIDHERLFTLAATIPNVLLTYDDDDAVREMAAQHGFSYKPITMRNNKHQQQQELFISHDLGWLV